MFVVGNSNTSSLGKTPLENYIKWSRQWVQNAVRILRSDATSIFGWEPIKRKDFNLCQTL